MADTMNINQLKSFVAVAEHGSFTDAAKERFIAQSAVSKHITALETLLGRQLLLRDPHSVRLTAAGEQFYQDCKDVLRRLDTAVDRLEDLSGLVDTRLTVGVFSILSQYAATLCRAFLERHPKVELRLEWHEFGDLIRCAEQGALDLAVTIGFAADARGQMRRKTIAPGRLCAVLNADTPLAARESLHLAELRGLDYYCMEPHVTPDGYVSIMRFLSDRGFHPRMIRRESHESSLLELKCRKNAYGLMSDAEFRGCPGLAFVPLAPEEQPTGGAFDLVAMWREDNENPCIPGFLALIDELYSKIE